MKYQNKRKCAVEHHNHNKLKQRVSLSVDCRCCGHLKQSLRVLLAKLGKCREVQQLRYRAMLSLPYARATDFCIGIGQRTKSVNNNPQAKSHDAPIALKHRRDYRKKLIYDTHHLGERVFLKVCYRPSGLTLTSVEPLGDVGYHVLTICHRRSAASPAMLNGTTRKGR